MLSNHEHIDQLLPFIRSCGQLVDVLLRCKFTPWETEALNIHCGNSQDLQVLWAHRGVLANEATRHQLPKTICLWHQGDCPVYTIEVEALAKRTAASRFLLDGDRNAEISLVSTAMACSRPAAIVSMQTNKVVLTNHEFQRISQGVPVLKWPSFFITPFWEFEGDCLSSPTKGKTGGYDYWGTQGIGPDTEALPQDLKRMYTLLAREGCIREYTYKGHRPKVIAEEIHPNDELPAEFCADVYLLPTYYDEPCRLCIQVGSRDISLSEGPPPSRH